MKQNLTPHINKPFAGEERNGTLQPPSWDYLGEGIKIMMWILWGSEKLNSWNAIKNDSK